MRRMLTVALAVTVILAGLAISLLAGVGKPIGADLSIVGQGRPALVVAYENYSPTGGDALSRLSGLREDFEDRMDFVVADLGVPAGRAFADRHQLGNGDAVLLAPDGRPLRTVFVPGAAPPLRELLEGALAELE